MYIARNFQNGLMRYGFPQKKLNTVFGDSIDRELTDLSVVLSRLLLLLGKRHGKEFPFNFYIYPGYNWYLRLIPRIKISGGFEIGTYIMINTINPKETFLFLQKHFNSADFSKIKNGQ